MIDPNDVTQRTKDQNSGAHHGADNEVLRWTISPSIEDEPSFPLHLDWRAYVPTMPNSLSSLKSRGQRQFENSFVTSPFDAF